MFNPRWTRVLVVVTLVLLLAAVSGPAANATGATKRVGLVIRYGDGTVHTEIVTVPVDATTLGVLQAAKISLVWTDTDFGPAVCKIGNDGCPADNCFCDPEHFWSYWHLRGTDWETSAVGVGNYIPDDRDVEGFAWTGFDANFNPLVKPPVYTFEQLLAMSQPPVQVPEPATLVLVGGGLAALAGYVQRRRGR